jgi:hypothetical protein
MLLLALTSGSSPRSTMAYTLARHTRRTAATSFTVKRRAPPLPEDLAYGFACYSSPLPERGGL